MLNLINVIKLRTYSWNTSFDLFGALINRVSGKKKKLYYATPSMCC